MGNSTAAKEAAKQIDLLRGSGRDYDDADIEGDDNMWRNLSKDEIQQLEMENLELHKSLESELDEDHKLEEQLSEISLLFDTFSSKVVEQHEQLGHILEGVIESRNSIEKGNTQLEEGLKRTASSQKVMIFFIFLASFSLLFLGKMRILVNP
jgi:hypothetical protein